MTAQPPLPLVPVAEAIGIGDAAALVEDQDGGGVFVHGVLTFVWEAGDTTLRRLAAVQLARLKAAEVGQIASAFGVDTATLWRWGHRLSQDGVGALVPGKRGPKGPSRLTQEMVTTISARRQGGATLQTIADEVGVATSTVRAALAQPSGGQHRPGPRDGQEHQRSGHTEDDQQCATKDTGDGGDGRQQEPTADTADGEVADLGVLALPDPRWAERSLARCGLLGAAAPVFTPAARVPLAGLFLGLPGLESTGLLEWAEQVYGALPAGFYGLATVLTEAVFRTLAGQPRAEGATRIDPVDLGRVLGMDRAPEVKTIRRKLGQLAAAGKGADLIAGMAAHHLARVKDEAGQDGVVLYVDGHVRAYQGTKKIAKTHLSRLRFPAPATVETWVCDAAGDPVLVVMAEPGASLVMELRTLLPQLRQAVGDDRRVLVGFDRGGWSPTLFKHMHQNRFDVLTWRKGPTQDVPMAAFGTVSHVDQAGREHTWTLAETTVDLPLTDGATFTMRQVTRLDERGPKPRQVHVLTTREDLPAGEVMYRMGSRWRQENYFRYGRLHLDLDSHDAYSATSDDPSRSVPNPDKRRAHQDVQAAQTRAQRERAKTDAALLAARTPTDGAGTVLITNTRHNTITADLATAQDDLATARTVHAATPTRVPLGQLSPDQQVLDTQTKLVTHAIKIAAFNTITTIARDIRLHTGYARADQEAYTLARQILTHTGDIDPRTPRVLTITLDPLPTGRATRALAQLCEHLTATNTTYPGTNRVLRYQVKDQP